MIKRLVLVCAVVLASLCGWAYPVIGTDTASVRAKAWTMQLGTAKARANAQNLPLLVVIIDSSSCGYCKTLDANIFQSSEWVSFLNNYPMFLVMVDRSKLTSSAWTTLTAAYRTNGGVDFPTVAIHAPDGTKLHQFLARNGYAQDPYFYNVVLARTESYYGSGTIGLSLASQNVSENSGELTVTVTREGSGAGAQRFSYTTVEGTAVEDRDFTATSGILEWADGEKNSKLFTVPLINDSRWTTPTQRVFTVTIAKVSGEAEVGTTVQTVTITEAEPYAPGIVGFTSDSGSVNEGAVYTGLVARTGGAVGSATVTLSSVDYHVDPATLSWADNESQEKQFTVSGIPLNASYDPRAFAVTMVLSAGEVELGLAEQSVAVRDQLVSATFEEYVADRPVYEALTQEDELWFYNETQDALRTEPLSDGESAVLAWTAPEAGRLTFTLTQSGLSDAPLGINYENSGTVVVEIGEQHYPLLTLIETHTVGVQAGEVVRWRATGQSGQYVVYLKTLGWEALTPVVAEGTFPVTEQKYQIDAVRVDTNLVDLIWQVDAENPSNTVYRLYSGSTAQTLVDQGAVVSGVNAVGQGLVNLTEAQGWIYWRVDCEVPTDYGTAMVQGPVWRFAVVDLPIFSEEAPQAGATLNAFQRANALIGAAADSTTPVTYSATGLPRGLTIDPATGVISGEARETGVFLVTVTASNSEGSTQLQFNVRTQDLPDSVSRVEFDGVLFASEALGGDSDESPPVVGTVNFNASSSGRLSATIETAGERYRIRGTWDSGSPDGTFRATLTTRTGETLQVSVTSEGEFEGSFDGQPVIASSVSSTEAAPYVGYYTVALHADVLDVGSETINNAPAGYGYLTFTVSSRGQIRYGGVIADGERISGSTALMTFTGVEMQQMGYSVDTDALFACFPVYEAAYRNRGTIAALVWIEARSLLSFSDNRIWLDNSMWYYPGKSTSLTDDAFLAKFTGPAEIVGGFFTKRQDLQLLFENAFFFTEDASLPVVVSQSSLTFDRRNELDGRLRGSSSTGLFSGTFKEVDAETARKQTQRFKGVLIVGDESEAAGFGAYQKEDDTTGSYRLERSLPVEINNAPR